MTDDTITRRGPGRPPLRADAQDEQRPDMRDAIPQGLKRKHANTEDKFFIPEEWKSPGWVYEWKVVEEAGRPVDPYELHMRRENHWAEVTDSVMPQLAIKGSAGHIIKSGLGLYRRPAYLNEEAKREWEDEARRNAFARREDMKKVPQGFEMQNNAIKVGYSPIPD